MSMGTKNDLTYPFDDIRMWRQIFSFVINNDDASDYGTIILKRESIFDLHILREDGWTIENDWEREREKQSDRTRRSNTEYDLP